MAHSRSTLDEFYHSGLLESLPTTYSIGQIQKLSPLDGKPIDPFDVSQLSTHGAFLPFTDTALERVESGELELKMHVAQLRNLQLLLSFQASMSYLQAKKMAEAARTTDVLATALAKSLQRKGFPAFCQPEKMETDHLRTPREFNSDSSELEARLENLKEFLLKDRQVGDLKTSSETPIQLPNSMTENIASPSSPFLQERVLKDEGSSPKKQTNDGRGQFFCDFPNCGAELRTRSGFRRHRQKHATGVPFRRRARPAPISIADLSFESSSSTSPSVQPSTPLGKVYTPRADSPLPSSPSDSLLFSESCFL